MNIFLSYTVSELDKLIISIIQIKNRLNEIGDNNNTYFIAWIQTELKTMEQDIHSIKFSIEKASDWVQRLEKELNDKEDEIEYITLLLKDKEQEIKKLNDLLNEKT